MVGGHRIPQYCQQTRAVNIFHGLRFGLHRAEKWRMTDIGGIFLPIIGRRAFDLNPLPNGITVKDLRILFAEHVGFDHFYRVGNFLASWPDIFQINCIALLIMT